MRNFPPRQSTSLCAPVGPSTISTVDPNPGSFPRPPPTSRRHKKKQTPFQDAPLDLDFCPLFYLNRRAAVDARLAEVRSASTTELVALVGDAWLTNAGTVCRGLHWERSSVRHLQVRRAQRCARAVV